MDFLGSGSTGYVSTDDFANGFQLNKLVLNSSATVAETIGGNSWAFAGTTPTITQSGTGAFNISDAITFNVAPTFNGSGTGMST